MKIKNLVPIAALFGAFAVILGAFGAHAIKDFIAQFENTTQRQTWWDLASKYHFWHSFLMMSIGLFAIQKEHSEKVIKNLKRSFVAAIIGIILFSGSLYLMTLTGIKMLGAITPFGGTAFIISWVLLALAARQGYEKDLNH